MICASNGNREELCRKDSNGIEVKGKMKIGRLKTVRVEIHLREKALLLYRCIVGFRRH